MGKMGSISVLWLTMETETFKPALINFFDVIFTDGIVQVGPIPQADKVREIETNPLFNSFAVTLIHFIVLFLY